MYVRVRLSVAVPLPPSLFHSVNLVGVCVSFWFLSCSFVFLLGPLLYIFYCLTATLPGTRCDCPFQVLLLLLLRGIFVSKLEGRDKFFLRRTRLQKLGSLYGNRLGHQPFGFSMLTLVISTLTSRV